MVDILLKNNRIHAWQHSYCGYAKGFAFWGTKLLQNEDLCRQVAEAWGENCLETCLYQLNGSFSMVLMREDKVLLVSDKLKTYPLLYFKTENGYAVTDLGDTVWATIIDGAFSELSVSEFLSAGYVGENRTLLQNCHVVPASSYVLIEGDGKRVMEKSYDRFDSTQESMESVDLCELEKVLRHVAERMRQVVQDRTIVLPLSGGYDSRLLACLCKRYEFPRVICYTYGIKESPEVEISRKVAGELGFEWLFVEYTSEKWAQFIESKDFEAYLHYGGNLKAIAHMQDLLAVRELKEKALLPENALIVPGHSGDFLGGSHFPTGLTRRNIAKKIFEKYFNINFLDKKNYRLVLDSLLSVVEKSGDSEEALLETFFSWGLRNRQANFIVNSVRAYEYEGYDWYLPLWDDEFVRYWRRIPCVLRKGSVLYEEALFNVFFKPLGVDYKKDKSEISRPFPIRILRRLFSNEQRYRLKRGMERMGIGFFPPERNAMDVAGKLIKKKDFCKDEPCVRYTKVDSMGMKSLYYLSLLRDDHVENESRLCNKSR